MTIVAASLMVLVMVMATAAKLTPHRAVMVTVRVMATVMVSVMERATVMVMAMMMVMMQPHRPERRT